MEMDVGGLVHVYTGINYWYNYANKDTLIKKKLATSIPKSYKYLSDFKVLLTCVRIFPQQENSI